VCLMFLTFAVSSGVQSVVQAKQRSEQRSWHPSEDV
jgi:hypothetical protein